MRVWAALATVAVFLLLLLGGVVSVTESGMGCGDDWPLCKGYLIPPLDDPATVLEWLHRVMGGLVGLLVLGAVVTAWRPAPDLAKLVLLLLILQIALGAVTVKLELPPLVSTLHMAVGTALLGALAALLARARPQPQEALAVGAFPVGLLGVALGATLLQIAVGAAVRHLNAGLACPHPVICWPSEHLTVNVQFAHRVLGLAVLGLVHAAAGRWARASHGGLRALAYGAMGLVTLQLVLGALTVSTRLHLHTRLTHMAVALVLFAILAYAYELGRTALRSQQTAARPEAASVPSGASAR